MVEKIEKILGRLEHQDLIGITSNKRILVTGGKGSVGQQLIKRCPNAVITDLEELDVTNINNIYRWLKQNGPFDYVIHLAGDKHAPKGEETPFNTLDINTHGIQNLIICLPGAHHILASTCKACNPETVYGATKLISERLILNSGGTVARFFNVIETQGNVFDIWKTEPREVYQCHRYFISLNEAVGLLINCLELKGKFAVNPGKIRAMPDVFKSLGYEGPVKLRRRGDRVKELLHSTSEFTTPHDNLLKITSYHD
jgi:FlaA1/EpsC-like NDP-sugar epimerase